MASKQPPIKDNTTFYSDLNFTPSEFKNKLWAAQWLFYGKNNCVRFLSPEARKKYQDLERGIINIPEYKKMIDPVTPMGEGGTAEYTASSWRTCPIDLHLENIVRAKLDRAVLDNKLQVSEIDKFAKSQKQRKKDKILYQRETRALINDLHSILGYNPLKESENPYSYIKENSPDEKKNMTESADEMLQYIESQIKDSQDLALYDAYLYKGDVELAFELGITHYLVNLNKWRVKCKSFNSDLLKHNRACGEWYTDETTGRGVVSYINPDELFTSGFKTRNGEDIIFWFTEEDITFAEFFRRFGQTLNDEQLKDVFELNKNSQGTHGMEWKNHGSVKGSNARIRVGRFSCLTQDAENFSMKLVNNKIPALKKEPLTWLPSKHTPTKYKSEQKMVSYNVWYSWEYVCPPGNRVAKNSPTDWEWQSQYIFNLKKNVDMYRYGVDERYAKSTLVCHKDERMSFYDIKESFMPKIRLLWIKFENNLVQDTTASIIDQDFITGLLNAVDEGNKTNVADPDNPTGGTGKDVAMSIFRSIRQGGLGLIKLRDKNGNLVVQDPSKLFFSYDSKHLEKSEKILKVILDQYSLMTLALSQNDITEGQEAKPRTPVAGIQASIASAKEGIWFIEDAAREFLIMYGERCAQHIITLVEEKKKLKNGGNSERWDEFASVIGLANSMLLESVEDLKPEEIGMTVSLEDIRANQQYVIELANKMADNGEVGREVVGMVMNQVTINYKYAYVLLMIAKKRKDEEKAHMEDLAHQREMELENTRLKTAMALTGAKGEAKDKNIITQGKVDEGLIKLGDQIKAATMQRQKEQLKQNRIDQDNNKGKLQTESKTQDAIAGT